MIDRRFVPFLLGLALAACGPKPDGNAPNASSTAGRTAGRPQTVSVAITKVESIPLIMQAQGNVIALDEVDLRAQKTGIIHQIHFNEGDDVKSGQLLFSLDARDDEANVKKAEARVVGSRAQLDIARRDWQRAQDLASKNFISQSGLDTARAKLDAAESTLAQEVATLESARVQLSYDFIRAPFAGRAGRVDVRPGSLVQANSTSSLVRITRQDPIGISFTLPERFLPALHQARSKGKARVLIDGPSGTTLRGEIVFIESSIDQTAGTIGIKARFANGTRELWPGQFVAVKVQAGEIANAVTLPAQAIQNNSSGQFVYVIDEDQTVSAQPVQVAQIYQERAVVTGIGASIKVVLEGGQNLRPGGKIVEAASAPANGRRGKDGRHGSAVGSAPAGH